MTRHRLVLPLAGSLALLGISAFAQTPALPPPPAATTVTASGATATTVSQAGTTTQVSTSTVSGGNAYNAFSAFQVAPGSTVNLLIPSAATNNNLLNLVSGSQTQIFGTVNSLLNSGAIGGNVFFADPAGIVIGTTGVVNVGSLTLSTPTSDFVHNFFNDVAGNTSSLLAGSEPLAADGLIAVAGQIHSVGPTTLSANQVDVSGGINTGAAQFTSLVNTTGLQTGQAITINGNTISIDGGLYGGTAAASLDSGSDDINLTANPSDTEALANAVAAITVGNATLSGNNINLTATATASSSDSYASEVTNIADTTSFPFNVLGTANVNSATANASINLGGGSGQAVLNATGNVKIASEADTTVSVITLAPIGDFSYGATNATATTDLAGNASITAGGNATLSTLINNKLYLNPSAVGLGTPSASVSYGNASSTSTTTLAGSVQAATISATADNENSFSTAAGAAAADNGIAGIGVALGFYQSQANATLSGNATATGADTTANNTTTSALNLAATSNDNTDFLSSASSVSADTSVSTVTQSATGGLAFVGDLADYLTKIGKSDENSESNSSPLALSAAVSYGSSSNQANASVTGTGTAQAGSVAVASNAQDTPQVSANGTASDAQASLGGGVAIANYSNTANTTVSGSVTGNQGVNIAANATLPDPFNLNAFTSLPGEFDNFQFVKPSSITDGSAYQQDWNAAETLGGDLVNVLNPNNSSGLGQFLNANLGLNNVVTSFVNTGASAEGGKGGGSSFGLAGSVNILGITNQATATVAQGAKVDAANNGASVNAEGDAFLINITGMAADLGQLKDKNPGASGDAALGGSYDGITLTNGATAAVDDGAQITAENGGAVNVNGNTNETLINIGQAGDNAGKFGVNGVFTWLTLNNTALGYIQSNAIVNAAGDVNVGANNNQTDFTIGGALGYGGNAEVGATVDWNQFTNTTEAYIGDPGDSRTANGGGSVTAGGNVNVKALANESLWNISLAAELATGQSQNDNGTADTSEGGGETSTSEGTGEGGDGSGDESFGLGISGNVSINDISDTTKAFINNAAAVLAAGQINLNATDTSWAVSAGLAAALATGGDTGVDLAGAFARNDFSKDTEATADNALLAGPLVNQLATDAASIGLDAENTGSLLTISAGGGVTTGEGASLAGSANNNELTNTTKAGLGSGAVADSTGAVTIHAAAADKVLSIAGALSYAGSAGLGAALDISNYSNTTDAYIGDGAQVNAGGNVELTASTDEKILPIAAALGISEEVGLGGSVVKDEVSNDTEATIGKANVSAGDNLLLGADDPSQLLLIAGSLGGSGTAGIGVAGSISLSSQPLLDRTVKATIGDGAQVSAPGNAGDAIAYGGQNVIGALLDATAEGNADTIVAGVGVAGDAGIAASLALNYFTEDVEADIASGASVNPNGPSSNKAQEVAANANDNTQILDVAGEIAGAGTVAIGASADVQTLNRTVQASLGGTINAAGNITANATLGGVDWSVAGAGSLAGTVDLAGAASAIFDTSTITAAVAPNANLYTPDSVLVDAEHDNTLNTIDGELGFSAEVGVGGAVSLVEQQDTTTADVGQGASVTALGNGPALNTWVNIGNQAVQGPVNGLAVVANANDNLLTIAAGGQITTGVSVAGSVVLNNIDETTQAYVDSNAVINPLSTQSKASPLQSVDLLANDGTTLTAGVGALAAGIDIYGVGVGAAVNLEGPLSQLPSSASGFTSSLTSDLNGTSDPNAVSPSGFSKLTTAGVNNGATVDALGGLDISALSSENLTNYLGSIAAGIVGVAGTVELDDYTPTTTAYFGNCAATKNCADTSAASANVGGATIAANDKFNYSAVVGEATLGGVGLGAAVLDSSVNATTRALVGINADLQTSHGAFIGSDFTDTFDAAALAGGAAAIAVDVPYISITDSSQNAALVADNATVAGGSGGVGMEATSRRTVASVAAAAELSALGAAAEIENVNFEGGNTAAIGNGDQVTGNGSFSMEAHLVDQVPEYLPANFARIPSISADSIPTGVLGAAVGGLAGVGGQVTLTENASDLTSVGNSTVTAGLGVNLMTNDDPSLYAASAGLEGGLLGAGASISDVYMTGQAGLSIGGNLTANNGAVNATSQLIENLTASATGIGGGLANGDGTVTHVNDSGSNHLTQSGTTTASADASLEANTSRNATATSGSTSYGLLAVGISFADLNLGGSTEATVNGTLNAGSNNTATVQASDNDTGNANAVVNAAGAANGIGAMAGSPDGFSADPSLINPTIETTVASGAGVNGGTIDVATADTSNLTSTANGGLSGAVNVGLLDAEGKVNPGLTLEMAGALAGGTITVQSTSNQSVTSSAQSSESSSLASGYSTSDGANASPDIHLYLDGSVNATGNALVESDSTNTVSASADAVADLDVGGFNLNILAGGFTNSTANIDNNNLIYLYGTLASSGGNSSFNAISTNQITQNNATGGTGSGVVTGADTTANSTLTDSTHANLVGTLTAVHGTAAQLAQGTEEAFSNAGDDTSGASGVNYIESNSTTSVTADIVDNVDGSAVVNANEYDLTATMPSLNAGSSATGIAEPGLHGDGDANSTLNLTLDPTVHVLSGANLTAVTINILANDGAQNVLFGDIFAGVDPTAGTHSASGSATANDTLNAYVDPTVNLDSGSTLNTDSLKVQALYPLNMAIGAGPRVSGVSAVTYVTEQVEETVNEVLGWIPGIGDLVKTVTKWVTKTVEEITDSTVSINNYGARLVPGSNINLNSTINQRDAVGTANLIIGANGQVEPGSSGLGVQSEDGSNIVVNSLVNDATGLSVFLEAEGGTIAGSPVLNIESMPPSVNITNNSNLNLVMQQLSPIGNGGGEVPFVIEADNNNLTPTFNDNENPTAITITNNGAGSVVFSNTISDQPGSLTVVNNGGNILDGLNGLIEVNQLSLDAPHGSIGTGGSLSCAICPGAVNGSLALGPLNLQPDEVAITANGAPTVPGVSAVAVGDIDLNLTPFESVSGDLITAAPSVNLTNILAGGNLNLALNPAQVQGVELQTITYQTIFGPLSFQFPVPVNGPASNTIYNVGAGRWLAAGGNLNLTALGGNGSQVTLNDDGLVASGFAGILFNIAPNGQPISVVTADGQQNGSLLNYLATLSGPPVLNPINASSGGHINIGGGNGALTGTGVLGVLSGESNVQVNNADAAGLTVQSLLDGGVSQSSITVFGANQPLSGTLAGSGVQLASYGVNGGAISVSSAGSLTVDGNLLAPLGAVVLDAQNQLLAATGIVNAGTLANLRSQGNMDLNLVTVGAGNLIANAGGTLNANAPISVSGDASLAAQGGLNLNELTAGHDAILSANLDIAAGNITAGADAILSAQANLLINTLAAGGNATLKAGNDLAAQRITAGGDASLLAGGDATVNTLQADGNAELTAGNTLNVSTSVQAGGNAQLTANAGNINLGAVAAGGDAVLTAGGSVNAITGTISAGHDADVMAQGDVLLGGVLAGNDVSLNSHAGRIATYGLVQAGQDVNMTAGGLIETLQGGINAGQDAALTAGANIVLGSALASPTNPLPIVRNAVPLTAGGNVVLLAGGDIAFGPVSGGGNVTMTAGGSINAPTGTLLAGGNAALNANGGSIYLGQVQAKAGDTSLTALQDINLGAVQAGADAALTAGGDINAAAGSVQAGNDANLSAGGDINLGTLTAGVNAILQAGGNINLGLDPGTITAGGDATLTAGGDINSPTGTITAGHDANLTAGNDITLGTLTAGNDATLLAGQDINLGSVTATAGNAGLTATAGDINLGSVIAGTDATLTAGGSILGPNGTISAGHDASLTAGNDITLGTLTAGNDATLLAGQSINLGSETATAGNAGLTATAGDINLGSVNAGTDATLTAGGSILGPNRTITAGHDASLTAGDDITLGTLTAGNDATLQAGQSINLGSVTATAGNAGLTATAGDINLGSVNAGKDATLTAGGSILGPTGTITAGHDSSLTAGDDITLGTLTAGNDATLLAGDDINLGAAGLISAGNTASLTTLTNDIKLAAGSLVIAPTALLTANRNISGGGTVNANVMQLAAETGAIGGSGNPLNLELNTLNGVTPTLTVASRGDSNLNAAAIGAAPGAAASGDREPVGSDPTLYADILNMLVGGNLNLNLNPGVVAGTQAVNAWYEIPAKDAAIAGGTININEAGANRDFDAVTLDVDGLLASGFQSLDYTVGPTGAWSATVTAAGQTVTGPVNFATIANGVINLSDINAAQGGQINVTGTGQLGNANHLFASNGPTSVTVNNEDPNLTLQANNITLGYGQGDVDIAHPSRSGGIVNIEGGWGWGNWGGPGWGDGDQGHGDADWDNQPTLTLDSAGNIVLAGAISNPGATTVAAQGNIGGGGLTSSRELNLSAVTGGIGTAATPLAVAVDRILNASAAGDIFLTAPTGDLPVGSIATPGNLSLNTAGSIRNALPGGDFDFGEGPEGHGDHDAPPPLNLSGANITLNAAGTIGDAPLTGLASGTWNVTAGTGINLVSTGNFQAGTVATAGGSARLAVNGNAGIGQLDAPNAALELDQPGSALTVQQATIGDSLNADADTILISQLTHSDAVQPLTLWLAGARDGMAQSITVNATSASPVLLQQYASENGSVSVAGDWLDVDNAIIGQAASFQNSWLRVALTNVDRGGRAENLDLVMVGNSERSRGDDLPATVTSLQAGTFQLPSTLTPAERELVRELGNHAH